MVRSLRTNWAIMETLLLTSLTMELELIRLRQHVDINVFLFIFFTTLNDTIQLYLAEHLLRMLSRAHIITGCLSVLGNTKFILSIEI